MSNRDRTRWALIASGYPLPGFDRATVLARLNALGRYAPGAPERFLNGQEVCVERFNYEEDAENKTAELRALGLAVNCVVEEPKRQFQWKLTLAYGIGFLVFFLYNKFSSDYQPVGGNALGQAQIQAVLNDESYPDADIAHFARLLRARDFYALENLLQRFDLRLENNIQFDLPYKWLIQDIKADNGVELSDLDAWVTETGSAHAYMARAAYYVQEGWQARGNKYGKETEGYKLANFKALQALGAKDAATALGLKKDLLPAYIILISAAYSGNTPIPMRQVLADAQRYFPGSLAYRESWILWLRPKWFGSYEEMNNFAAQARRYFALNPRLSLLYGYADAEMGNVALKQGNHGRCVTKYSKAMQHGVHSEWLDDRAECLYELGDYALALDDINLSLRIRPDAFSENLRRRIMSEL